MRTSSSGVPCGPTTRLGSGAGDSCGLSSMGERASVAAGGDPCPLGEPRTPPSAAAGLLANGQLLANAPSCRLFAPMSSSSRQESVKTW